MAQEKSVCNTEMNDVFAALSSASAAVLEMQIMDYTRGSDIWIQAGGVAEYGFAGVMTASINAAEAKTRVAQKFPASRDAVEKSAAANASTNPTSASRKRIQTSGRSR